MKQSYGAQQLHAAAYTTEATYIIGTRYQADKCSTARLANMRTVEVAFFIGWSVVVLFDDAERRVVALQCP